MPYFLKTTIICGILGFIMVQVASIVTSVTQETSSNTLTLPRSLMGFYMAAHKIHRAWRWIRIGKVYTNPDNFLALSAGHGANALFGKSLLLRISAVCVLIATRILECVEQQKCLQTAWTNLSNAYHDRFTPSTKITWEKKGKQFLSSSTITWWRFQYKKTITKIQRISICTFHLIKEGFILSMRMIDTIETFYLSPQTQNEGINQLFVNGTKWIEKLVDNKDILVDGLVSNKEIIVKILEGVNSPITSDQLIKTTKNALTKTETVYNAVQGASKGFGGFVVACGKKWGYEFLHNLGLHHLVPNHLVPPSRPPWETPPHKIIDERYPPIKKTTRPSKIPKPKPKPKPKTVTPPVPIPATKKPPPVSKPTSSPIEKKAPTTPKPSSSPPKKNTGRTPPRRSRRGRRRPRRPREPCPLISRGPSFDRLLGIGKGIH